MPEIGFVYLYRQINQILFHNLFCLSLSLFVFLLLSRQTGFVSRRTGGERERDKVEEEESNAAQTEVIGCV